MKVANRPSRANGKKIYAGGNSKRMSDRVYGSIPAQHPGTATIGLAVGGVGVASVSWSAPSGPAATAPTGYEVRRHNSAGTVLGTTTLGNVLTSGAIASVAGTAVKFTVRAINAKGNGQYSAFSNTVTPT